MRKNLRTILLVFGIIISIVLIDAFFINSLKDGFYLISSPIEKFFLNTGNSLYKSFTSLFKARELEKENEKLSKENLSLISRNIKLSSLIKENNCLTDRVVCFW